MARAIDADDLKRAVESFAGMLSPAGGFLVRQDAVLRAIELAPTIEAEPVKHGYVPIEVVRQIQWERDIAMSYLDEAGIGFGEKAELQRVKHGKWVKRRYTTGYQYIKCSECRMKFNSKVLGMVMDFCPNCGADMRGE